MTSVPTIALNNGTSIPQLGFGVFRVDPEETERVVRDALDVGYRHLDTAAIYGNEEGVGRGIAGSGVDRDDLFVTTKLWNDRHGDAEAALDESLAKLGTDHVDLYLIHWPGQSDTFVEAWRTLVRLAESGKARAIGVSNHNGTQIDRLIEETGVTPAVDQVELHVDFQQTQQRAYNQAHGIATEAWYPLGGGSFNDSKELAAIAEAHGTSVAQTIIRWHLQLGNVVIPKSSHRERMAENFDVLGFTLGEDEMATIANLDGGAAARKGPDPSEIG